MKAFKAVFVAIDQTDGQLKEFVWKPVFAESREDAERVVKEQWPFLRIVESDSRLCDILKS